MARVGPGVVILGAVGDEEEDPGARQALDEGVEEGVGLRVHPVQAVEDQEQRLDPALAQEQPPQRVQHVLAAAERVEQRPLRIIRGRVEHLEEGGCGGPGALLQRVQLGRDLVADRALVVARVDLEIGPEQLDERQVRGGLAGGDADGLQDAPPVRGVRMQEFADQPRLAHPRLGGDRHDLPVSRGGALEGLHAASPSRRAARRSA